MRMTMAMIAIMCTLQYVSGAFQKAPYAIYGGEAAAMSLHWQLDATQACTLSWGLTEAYETATVVTAESGSGVNEHRHSHVIANLLSGTRYYYRVTRQGGETATGNFLSAPDAQRERLTLYALGESSSRPDTFAAVCSRLLLDVAQQPDERQTLVLHTGDFSTDFSSEAAWQAQLFDPARALMARMPLAGCRGDNESDATRLRKYLPYPFRAAPAAYYSFRYGPLFVVVLDDMVSLTAGTPQSIWFRDIMSESTARWNVVVCHQPSWSAGPKDNVVSKQTILHYDPILYHNVCLVLSSHNHYYSRAMTDGIAYITTGGAGADLDSPLMPAQNVVRAEAAHHFVRLEFAGDSLVGTALRTDGSVIERFVVSEVTGLSPNASPARRETPSHGRPVRYYDIAGRLINRNTARAQQVLVAPGLGKVALSTSRSLYK